MQRTIAFLFLSVAGQLTYIHGALNKSPEKIVHALTHCSISS